MMKPLKVLALTTLAGLSIVLAAACGGDGALIGEACTTAGSETECVDGAVCDTVDTTVVCLEICTDQADCAANEACNGVSGSSLKACHPKK